MKAEQRTGRHNKILILAVLLLAASMVFLGLAIWKALRNPPESMESSQSEAAPSVHVFQLLPDVALTDADGKEQWPADTDGRERQSANSDDVERQTANSGGRGQQTADLGGGTAALLFWASWCPHCRENMASVKELVRTAEESGAQLYLVDKLDGEKETREQALALLEEYGLEEAGLFDEGGRLYEEAGIHMLPTLLVADGKNRVLSMIEGSFPTAVQLKSMLKEAREGKSRFLAGAICRALVDADGAMRTGYLTDEGAPGSGAALSESQGILMEYAAQAGDRELFEAVWSFTDGKRLPEGLTPWIVSGGENTEVNALVDDLRIIGALQAAEKSGLGSYRDEISRYGEAVLYYNTEEGKPVDFYDVESGRKAGRFTLCYGDLKTLAWLAEEDERYREVYDNTLELMLGGRISDSFPLYYSYYDYAGEKYSGDRLNMAEELTALLHLAEAGELPGQALDWLEKEMDQGCVYAAYDLEGRPAEDGYYESTAVYALLAMIALEENREALAGKAINRMEQFRVRDMEKEWDGLFGNNDGSGIYSFDQGMALLAFQRYERAVGYERAVE